MNKKTLLIVGVCAAVLMAVVAIATFALVKNSSPNTSNDSSNNDSSSQTKEFKGKVVCLPKKGDGPQTLECAYGIQTTNGKYYAVNDGATTPAYKNIQEYPTDSEVIVTGTVTAPSADQNYDVVGVIAVTNIRAAE